MKAALIWIITLFIILTICILINVYTYSFINHKPIESSTCDYRNIDIAIDMTGIWDENKSNNQLKRKGFKPGSTRKW